MIGYCNRFKKEVLSEADCHWCDYIPIEIFYMDNKRELKRLVCKHWVETDKDKECVT